MTVTGAGGVTITVWRKLKRFHRDYEKPTIDLRDRVDAKLQDLTRAARPSGLEFEKLKGYIPHPKSTACTSPEITR